MTVVPVQIDEEMLARAKELAAMGQTTVEEMIQRLVRVALLPPLKRSEMSPNLRAVVGIAPPMTDEEVERVLDEERMRKYGS